MIASTRGSAAMDVLRAAQHRANIGAAYFWLTLVKGGRELQQHAFEDWMQEGYRALGVMERHLKEHRYIVADRYTVADIALYAYTHVAHLCDYDLTMFHRSGAGSSASRRNPACTHAEAAGECYVGVN